MLPIRNYPFDQGFTLIEMIVVITVTAILAAGAALFIRNPTQAYFDTEAYANLTDRADTAMRRVTRELSNALPNSIRLTASGGNTFLEFIPIKSAGRYRAEVGLSVIDDPLDFTLSSDTFDVLGDPINIDVADQLVIYNLGTTGADAYEGSNRRNLTVSGTLQKLAFNGGAFPLMSPSSRFYIVAEAVSLVCDMTSHQLLMYRGYAIPSTQPDSVATLNSLTSPRVLASNVSSCAIQYAPGVLQRNGIVTVYLELTQENAKVHLVQMINMVNSP